MLLFKSMYIIFPKAAHVSLILHISIIIIIHHTLESSWRVFDAKWRTYEFVMFTLNSEELKSLCNLFEFPSKLRILLKDF